MDFGACKVALAAMKQVTKPRSIATALPNITASYCKEKGLDAEIIELDGSLEFAPKLGLSEAIVDQVVSGDTLSENNLEILDVLMESQVFLVANKESLDLKKDEIYRIVLSMKGVLESRKRLLLQVNAKNGEICNTLVEILPAMKSPNVSPIAEGGFSLAAAIPKSGLTDLVAQLKQAGGTDIVVCPLKMVIL